MFSIFITEDRSRLIKILLVAIGIVLILTAMAVIYYKPDLLNIFGNNNQQIPNTNTEVKPEITIPIKKGLTQDVNFNFLFQGKVNEKSQEALIIEDSTGKKQRIPLGTNTTYATADKAPLTLSNLEIGTTVTALVVITENPTTPESHNSQQAVASTITDFGISPITVQLYDFSTEETADLTATTINLKNDTGLISLGYNCLRAFNINLRMRGTITTYDADRQIATIATDTTSSEIHLSSSTAVFAGLGADTKPGSFGSIEPYKNAIAYFSNDIDLSQKQIPFDVASLVVKTLYVW